MKFNQTNLLQIITVLIISLLTLVLFVLDDQDIQEKLETPKTESLNIPKLLEYSIEDGIKKFELNVQEGQYEFITGISSNTYGYNGDILGPTIRFSKGDKVDIHVTNTLNEQTTTHWHGGIVPGDADGGVHNIIPSGEDWNARFDVIQQASTLWYHPHQHEQTARQVYMGLGGFMIIDDENSNNLNIPNEYGVDDIPIIIQSKNLDVSGQLIPYQISRHDQIHGFEGNTVLINAQIQPNIQVDTNILRLRMLNGSNSDIYNISFSEGHKFSVIASDGGFYNNPIDIDSLQMHPAKRFEILIDLSDIKGETISLNINGQKQMSIEVLNKLSDKYQIPTNLNNLKLLEYNGQVDRNFDLELLGSMGMMGGSTSSSEYSGPPVYGINGELFDMNRIDFKVQNNSIEYWRVTNIGDGGPGLYHPFHVHATQFRIVEFNGEKPSILLRGLHDTIVLNANESAVIAIEFDKSIEGIYMYHCHILEHEDAGMMGQFEIYNKSE